jgi:hypothetical protein
LGHVLVDQELRRRAGHVSSPFREPTRELEREGGSHRISRGS